MNPAPASISTAAKATVPLPEMPRGTVGRVQRIDGEHVACQRLREMGFCEEAEIQILKSEGSVVCQVCGSRVGLSRQVAGAIHVAPIS